MDQSSAEIKQLLDRLRDREPGAVQELIARGHARLRKLAAKMMNESFPKLVGMREVDSVVNETYIRLAKALDKVDDFPSTADFFKFAAFKVRQTLLDMAGAQRAASVPAGPVEDSTSAAGFDPGMTTLDPAKLAVWSELHRQVEKLDDDVKAVFAPCYYLGLSQAEVAAALDLHPRAVSRLWFKATIALKQYLPDGE